MDSKITSERYKVNPKREPYSKYQVMMMTKGKRDIIEVEIDNQLLVQMKLLGVNN